jgi:hypothetical protein
MKDGEGALAGGIKKLNDILVGMAEKLDDLAESLETGGDEPTEQVAAPLIDALDSISAIVNGATEKVMEISSKLFDYNEPAEKALECNTCGNNDY